MDLISVIVPVYNVEKYLPKCMESILNQTYKNFEIILVDDGSADKSLDVCYSYAKKDNRVKVFSQQNGGPSKARNTGLKNALGKYVAFVDSDDWLEQNYLEYLHDAITENNCDMAICNYLVYDDNENIIARPELNFDKYIKKEDIYNFYYSEKSQGHYLWNKLYNKDVFKNIIFPENIYCGEDTFVTVDICNANKNGAIVVDLPLYNYIVKRKSSLTNDTNEKKYYDLIIASEQSVLLLDKTTSAYKYALRNLLFMYMQSYYKVKDKKTLLAKINKLYKDNKKLLLKKDKLKYFVFRYFRVIYKLRSRI